MAENTFKSPGFFEQEIELTAEKQEPTGVPAGIVGAAQMGPAFVPMTLGTFTDFENRFGTLTPEKFAPYAVREWLKNRSSVTFLRVLGAGSNSSATDFATTRKYGTAKNAGFKAIGTNGTIAEMGNPQFLTAKHIISANSDIGYPMFTDSPTLASSGLTGTLEKADADGTTGNDVTGLDQALRESTPKDDIIHLCRAMILNTSGSFFQIKNNAGSYVNSGGGIAHSIDGSNEFDLKLVLADHTSANDVDLTWGNFETTTVNNGTTNIPRPNRNYRVSLDPDNTKYIGKVLNTDPKKFQEEGHLLYLDWAVEHELAPVLDQKDAGDDDTRQAGDFNVDQDTIYLSTGATNNTGINSTFASDYASTHWENLFGWFNSRYQAPKTTSFISQPFGSVEYDLFHFECMSDGHVANNEFKVSISNIRKSIDPNNKFGQFDVEIRRFGDSDFRPEVLERYVACNLNPASEDFVAKKIGDKKVVFDFDAELEEERRLVISGRYPNRSLNVRIVMNDAVYKGQVPEEALPFGFKGIPQLNVNTHLADANAALSFVPPMPFTFKQTKGKVKQSSISYQGHAGDNERTDARVYWGVKTTRIEDNKLVSGAILQSNLSGSPSKLVNAYTKFQGIPGGSIAVGNFVADADTFHANKFSLANVALAFQIGTDLGGASAPNYSLISSADTAMKDACYIRNGSPDPSDYSVVDNHDDTSYSKRPTFASLVHDDTANNFNKFSKFAKFTNVFYGGWDGLNILDEDIEDLNDKSASTEAGGKAAGNVTGGLGLIGTNNGEMMGKGQANNVVSSYRQAIKQMTDPMTVRTNLLVIPGIRDPYIADFAADSVRDYGMGMYVMDVPNYNGSQDRIFDTGSRPDVEFTGNNLEARALDNNYVASYFPDVFITDSINNRRVLVPASIAALGALGYSDSVSYPWFAPAGFNRGALDFVENVRTRLSVADRDDLYERRINPIANFPNGGFVIFGQKTMQVNQSALDRVNVRRLLLEVKRQVSEVAGAILFEQNTVQTRERFVKLVNPRLGMIQAQAGIEQFRVICDETNNTPIDAEQNRLNGKIILVPTRTIEFIALDFIITNSGVSFE